jgi:uridine kinase
MTGTAHVEFSISTWQQPLPPPASAERARVLEEIVDSVVARGDHRLRVAIDGLTASGKTSLGHELAARIADRGRPVFRASLDDFKRPWRDRHLYDRETGEGYYRNAFDVDAARTLLLEPSGPTANGVVSLCSIDPITQIEHAAHTTAMPPNGVLIVDGVFAFRPNINAYWDLRVWVEIDDELSVQRGVARDAEMLGDARKAEELHRTRYLVGERLYIAEVDPRSLVDVILDNTDFDRPRLVRRARLNGVSARASASIRLRPRPSASRADRRPTARVRTRCGASCVARAAVRGPRAARG